MEAYALPVNKQFQGSLEKFLELIQKLQSGTTQRMQLSSLESLVAVDGREVFRLLLEEQIQQRGVGDFGPSIEGQDGIERTHRRERTIKLKTIFGEIKIERLIYSKPESTSLIPKEAILNIPENSYSHGLQQMLSHGLAKNSYSEAIAAVKERTSVDIPRRQAEDVVRIAATDFQDFYEDRGMQALRKATRDNEFVVLTTDGKGIVMRKEDLREATKKRADETEHKLKTRLSKGEKKNAKRMAQVASVYSIEPHERTAEQIVSGHKTEKPPKPQAKRVWASLESDAKDVVSQMFDEAVRRDPHKKRDWVVLVDGQQYQLGLIKDQISSRNTPATIILDIVHVIEYLWKAARDFHPEASADCEAWVSHYLLMILEGKAKQAAAAIRRSATCQVIEKREAIEKCATYLHNNAPYMNYDKYLAAGSPIGTGVIEGACRHLVKDRMDITGARWSLKGAEAVLQLRSICASGDWEEYWAYHEAAEYKRNHRSLYVYPERMEKVGLRLVK